MAAKKGHRPERIGEILQERIEALGWGQRMREEDIYPCWEEVVGPQVAAHTRPSHISNRRLTIVTENSVWTQQLLFLKSEILRGIRRRFGPDLVTELYFVTGRIEPAAAPPAPPSQREEAPPAPIPEDLEQEITAIRDADVRDAVRRLCRAGFGRRTE
jgi:hypothetical protein